MTTATRPAGAARESRTAGTGAAAPAARSRGRDRQRPSRWSAPWRAVSDWLDRPLASLHLILAVFALMLGFGLLMVLSASSAASLQRTSSAFSVFTNQVLFAGLGFVAFFFVSRMSLRIVRALSTTAIIVSLALLTAVLIPHIGTAYNGARSWISIGSSFQFQPSEVAKLALLLWAANVLASGRGQRRRLRSLLLPVGPVFALMVGLVMLEPDLGTTVTLALVFFAVLYFAGAPWWMFGGIAVVGVAGVAYLSTSAGYRVARIDAWLHPATANAQYTYQTFQGYDAMGSGGLLGVGIGQSKMKWGRLPNADSDFIFAVIGEELGLIGTLTVVLLFAVLAYTGLRIARRNVDPFVKLVAAGGTVWLVGQAAINVGYVVGLLPVTGIPLPMFSTGGTSLVVTMVVFGLLTNFARREPQAVAALRGSGPRGLTAFLGLGEPVTGRPVPRRVARRRAKRDARRSAAVRRRVEELEHYGARQAERIRVAPPPRGRQQAYRVRRTLGFPVPERGRRKAYRARRALGFPVPGERPVRAGSRGRPARPGRTVRP